MVVMNNNMNDYQSQRKTTTFGVTFALNNVFRKDSEFGPFHTIGTSFCCVCVGDYNESAHNVILQKQSRLCFVNEILATRSLKNVFN
jgi:hypothetical protein